MSDWNSNLAYAKPTEVKRTKHNFSVDPNEVALAYSRYCLQRRARVQSTRGINILCALMADLHCSPSAFFAAQSIYWLEENEQQRALPFLALTSDKSIERYKKYFLNEILTSICHRIKIDSVPHWSEMLQHSPELLKNEINRVEIFTFVLRDPYYALVCPSMVSLIESKSTSLHVMQLKRLVIDAQAECKIHGSGVKEKLLVARQQAVNKIDLKDVLRFI